MIWVLIQADRLVWRGSYAEVLATAEEWLVAETLRHEDGTVIARRLLAGWRVLPAAMVPHLEYPEAA